MDGKESGCVSKAIVLDMRIGNIVTENKISVTGRSSIVCTGIYGAHYNVIKNNEAIDHQAGVQLGAYFWGSYNVIEDNKIYGQVKMSGNNNVFSGNTIYSTGQQGGLINDDGKMGGNFIGGMGPGAGNLRHLYRMHYRKL